jgi:hypothetical protein
VVTPKTEGSLLLTDWGYDWDQQTFTKIVCELRGYPGWRILPDVAVTERGLMLRRLVIEPASGMPGPDITTRMLRELRTGKLLAALRAAQRQASTVAPGVPPDLTVSKRAGRRGRPDLYYARWAAAYTEALAQSAHPVDDLAAQYNLSPSQIRNLVHASRKRALLTASPPGRAGGELTPRARQLLETQSEGTVPF